MGPAHAEPLPARTAIARYAAVRVRWRCAWGIAHCRRAVRGHASEGLLGRSAAIRAGARDRESWWAQAASRLGAAAASRGPAGGPIPIAVPGAAHHAYSPAATRLVPDPGSFSSTIVRRVGHGEPLRT